MKFLMISGLIFVSIFCSSMSKIPDWLVTPIDWPARVYSESNELVLTNGLLTKRFLLTPGLFATTEFYSHEKNSSLLRAIAPEAIIELDGVSYNVGGFLYNTTLAYLNRTDMKLKMKRDISSFQFVSYNTRTPEAPYRYIPKRGAPPGIVWPPKGIHLQLNFMAPKSAPSSHKSLIVTVHYELYEGVPIVAKWISLNYTGNAAVVKASIAEVERLRLNWQWASSAITGNQERIYGNPGYNWLLAITDQPHGTLVTWKIEENATVTEPGSFQPYMKANYTKKFNLELSQNTSLTSFRVFEVLVGSSDPERIGLANRRLTRLLAPQTQENPIYFHMTEMNSTQFRKTVDQLVDVGFEMIMYSFGSGFDLESTDPQYLKQLKSDIAYANSKGIEVGGYDLIALTRRVDNMWMALDADGRISDSSCFASGWYDTLLKKVLDILTYANLTAIETDGPYGGYSCSSTNHSHHQGEDDSVYQQNVLQGQFFKILREKEMYINQPDTYFFQGGSKTGMGYDESQYSLPRWVDLSISRQGMFDDTFHYIPSQGWMFLPLVVYHAGGAAAMFEPLSQHLKEYEWGLAQYLGAGVAACYRGTRVYDTPETKDVVKKWVEFYKKYRIILNGDLIHVRRADMQSIDSYLHINNVGNAADKVKGLAFFFNPTDQFIEQTIEIPLYYTGLTTQTQVVFEDMQDTKQEYQLARDYTVEILIRLNGTSVTWATFAETDDKV